MAILMEPGVYCGFMEIFTDKRQFITDILGHDAVIDRDAMTVTFPGLNKVSKILEDTGFSISFESVKF